MFQGRQANTASQSETVLKLIIADGTYLFVHTAEDTVHTRSDPEKWWPKHDGDVEKKGTKRARGSADNNEARFSRTMHFVSMRGEYGHPSDANMRENGAVRLATLPSSRLVPGEVYQVTSPFTATKRPWGYDYDRDLKMVIEKRSASFFCIMHLWAPTSLLGKSSEQQIADALNSAVDTDEESVDTESSVEETDDSDVEGGSASRRSSRAWKIAADDLKEERCWQFLSPATRFAEGVRGDESAQLPLWLDFERAIVMDVNSRQAHDGVCRPGLLFDLQMLLKYHAKYRRRTWEDILKWRMTTVPTLQPVRAFVLVAVARHDMCGTRTPHMILTVRDKYGQEMLMSCDVRTSQIVSEYFGRTRKSPLLLVALVNMFVDLYGEQHGGKVVLTSRFEDKKMLGAHIETSFRVDMRNFSYGMAEDMLHETDGGYAIARALHIPMFKLNTVWPDWLPVHEEPSKHNGGSRQPGDASGKGCVSAGAGRRGPCVLFMGGQCRHMTSAGKYREKMTDSCMYIMDATSGVNPVCAMFTTDAVPTAQDVASLASYMEMKPDYVKKIIIVFAHGEFKKEVSYECEKSSKGNGQTRSNRVTHDRVTITHTNATSELECTFCGGGSKWTMRMFLTAVNSAGGNIQDDGVPELRIMQWNVVLGTRDAHEPLSELDKHRLVDMSSSAVACELKWNDTQRKVYANTTCVIPAIPPVILSAESEEVGEEEEEESEEVEGDEDFDTEKIPHNFRDLKSGSALFAQLGANAKGAELLGKEESRTGVVHGRRQPVHPLDNFVTSAILKPSVVRSVQYVSVAT